VFNVGGAAPISLKDLAAKLVGMTGAGRVECVPWPEEKKAIDIGSFYADSTKLARTTGWTPSVSLDDGLRRTIDFYRTHLAHYVDGASAPERA
jgi:nucleoside-diphosphate-sugar epimerase